MAGTEVHRPPDAAYYRQLVEEAPPGAPAVATFRFLPALSSRHTLATFHYAYMGREKVAAERKYVLPDEVTYALLDLQRNARWTQFADPRDSDNFRRMLEDGHWGVEARREQLVLLRKDAPPDLPRLFRPIEDSDLAAPLTIDYGGLVKLIGIEAERERFGEAMQFRVRTAWEVLQKAQFPDQRTQNLVDDRLLIDFALFDQSGTMAWSAGGATAQSPRVEMFLDNLALAPEIWEPGDRFEVEHAFVVPESVPSGTYRLGLLVASKGTNIILPPSGPALGRIYGHIMNLSLTDED